MKNLTATSLNHDIFLVNNRKYTSRLFHCFGDSSTTLNISTILKLLEKSGTQFLTLNTHNIKNLKSKNALVLGYTNITLDYISKLINISAYTVLNNTNLAESRQEAVHRSMLASRLSGSSIIKLEVINKEHTLPINEDVVKATEALVSKGYEVMPLINAELRDAKELQDIGCSLVRLVGSPIGSMRGIEDSNTIKQICQTLTIPVIVDGGIGRPQDVIKAMKLGADGVLVNKAVFASKDPVLAIEQMKSAVIIGRRLYLKGDAYG